MVGAIPSGDFQVEPQRRRSQRQGWQQGHLPVPSVGPELSAIPLVKWRLGLRSSEIFDEASTISIWRRRLSGHIAFLC